MITIIMVLLMYLITGAMLLILTVLLYQLQLSEEMVSIGIVLTYVISGCVGGFLAGRKMKKQKFFWGLLMGACYFLVLVIGSLIFRGGLDMEIGRTLTTLIMCGAAGMVGGMIS